MLSEILMTAVSARGRVPRPDREPGLSCSTLFPCPYALYKIQKGEAWEEELTPQQILNMEDGWFQEEESVQRLKEIGIIIRDRQARVDVGKSHIGGRIDGTVTLDKKRLWEHKAWGSAPYDWFLAKGIDIRPGEKAQVNAYMLGMGLDECIFFVKRKENNNYLDVIVPLDKDFILPIIGWADRIRLENWVPEPKLTQYCAHCGFNCFGPVLDFSWITEAKAPEMAEKWKQGDKLVKVGSMLKEEARTFFVGSRDGQAKGIIGDRDLLVTDGLKITRVIQHRMDIRRELVLREFGPEGLVKVIEEKDITQFRFAEVEE